MIFTPVATGGVVADDIFDPQRLEEYMGQEPLIRELMPELLAAIEEGRSLASQCWYGAPGLGKTTLAYLLGRCRGVTVNRFQGSRLTQRDLDAYFGAFIDPRLTPKQTVNMEGYSQRWDAQRGMMVWGPDGRKKFPSICLIDEAESLKRSMHQSLQDVVNAVEGGHRYYQSTIGGRGMDIYCPDVTLIFITNSLDELLKHGAPNVNRCAIKYRFEPYTVDQITTIILQFASKEQVLITPQAATELAGKSRGTPRTALQLFRKARNVLSSINLALKGQGKSAIREIDHKMALDAMQQCSIDYLGLNRVERQYLLTIYQAPDQTMPLEGLTDMLGEQDKAVRNVIEPTLMQMGLVMRFMGRGRRLTAAGIEYCGRILSEAGGSNAAARQIPNRY